MTKPEQDRATVTDNTRTKFGEGRTCSSRDMLADTQTHRQTDRQTDRHGHHNTPLSYWDGVIIRPYRVHRMDAAYIGLLPGLPWVWRSPWVWGGYGDNLPPPQTHGDSMEIFQST